MKRTTTALLVVASSSALSAAGLGLSAGQAGATPLRTQDEGDATALREYLSGNGLLNRGLYDLAAEEYRKFLAAHPNHAKAPVARYGLGVALNRLGRNDEA